MEHSLHYYKIPWSDLSISIKNIADAIGYRDAEIPEPVLDAITESLVAVQKLWAPSGGYCIIPQACLVEDELYINEVTLRIGKVIAGQLSKLEKVAVFACTAGPHIESWSKELMAQNEFLQGYIVDAIASEAVEKAMDIIQNTLKKEMQQNGYGISQRYSPGYCDWSVSQQQALFSLVPENFCGISLTESSLMMPIKSISGIIGICKEMKAGAYQCGICELTTCFRRHKK